MGTGARGRQDGVGMVDKGDRTGMGTGWGWGQGPGCPSCPRGRRKRLSVRGTNAGTNPASSPSPSRVRTHKALPTNNLFSHKRSDKLISVAPSVERMGGRGGNNTAYLHFFLFLM